MKLVQYPFSLLILFFLLSFSPSSKGEIVISNDTTWSGTISVSQDIRIRHASTLRILPGTILLMNYGVSIKAEEKCHLIITGSDINKVVVKSATPQTYWGELYAKGNSSSVQIDHADISGGSITTINGALLNIDHSFIHDNLYPESNIVYTEYGVPSLIRNSHFANYVELNLVKTKATIEYCLFEYIAADGIDFDNAPDTCIIRNCTFRNGLGDNIDAIDWGKVNFRDWALLVALKTAWSTT
jgi:hypothetical protein